jgi:hypothetical protein
MATSSAAASRLQMGGVGEYMHLVHEFISY